MRPGRRGDDATGSSATPRVVPLRVLERVPLSEELAEAVGAALAARETATDHVVRIALTIRIRRTLEAWLDGAMTSEQAARELRGEQTEEAT
jgi:hypothetical protein